MKKSLIIGGVVLVTIILVMLVGVVLASMIELGSGRYKVEVKVREGWNLLQGFHPDLISTESPITTSNIKAVFMYSPDLNKYIEMYPSFKLPSAGLDQNDEYYDDASSAYAYWVYIEDVGNLNKLIYTIKFGEGDIQMKKGWNFVGINSFMTIDVNTASPEEEEKYTLNNFKGNCNFEKVYHFESVIQEWSPNLVNDHFMNEELDNAVAGLGILIKVSDNCHLGSGGSGDIGPPGLPGGDNFDTYIGDYIIQKDFGEFKHLESRLNSNIADVRYYFPDYKGGEQSGYELKGTYDGQWYAIDPIVEVVVVEYEDDISYAAFNDWITQLRPELIPSYEDSSNLVEGSKLSLVTTSEDGDRISYLWASNGKLISVGTDRYDLISDLDLEDDFSSLHEAYLKVYPSTLVK